MDLPPRANHHFNHVDYGIRKFVETLTKIFLLELIVILLNNYMDYNPVGSYVQCNINKSSKTISILSPLSLATDVTDMTLGASGLWLGTRTGTGGIPTLA